MTSTADTDGPSGWPFGPGEMRGLIRTHDWAATPIGPMARWSRSLRLAVDLILESPLAMILLWGEDLVQIYNDGYREVMAGKHPSGLGQPSPEFWPEVRSFTVPVPAAVLRGEGRSFRGTAEGRRVGRECVRTCRTRWSA